MKEFIYKGAKVRPYEPFHENYSERFLAEVWGGVSFLVGRKARFDNHNRR